MKLLILDSILHHFNISRTRNLAVKKYISSIKHFSIVMSDEKVGRLKPFTPSILRFKSRSQLENISFVASSTENSNYCSYARRNGYAICTTISTKTYNECFAILSSEYQTVIIQLGVFKSRCNEEIFSIESNREFL